MIHQDERRILEDWPEAKIITAKTDCELGNHYHKVKTEKFVLVEGNGKMTIDGYTKQMVKGSLYTVSPGMKHSFKLTEDSILIGLCSHPFDPTDDYKL
jgi:quercetin dioxygenase-like cupin family protein